ncbi:glycoside hydrolase family 88 protein [Geodermatophilus sp. SYSU D01186]
MLQRVDEMLAADLPGFPHWADPATGEWLCTEDGDWTGGAWPGMLWYAARTTANPRYTAEARHWCERMRSRAGRATAFKGFGFFHGVALGDVLTGDESARALALEAAQSLVEMYDPALGLIPLGPQAEESHAVGTASSSIDSLQATPLLIWAYDVTGEPRYAEVARAHTARVLDIHVRADGSVVQSSELDAATGQVLHTHTHKGFSDTSTWCRAQAWAVLYAAVAACRMPGDDVWTPIAVRVADWWLESVPDDLVAFWDFDDPRIPETHRDTSGTAIVASGLLRLGAALGEAGSRYTDAGRRTVEALVDHHLTPHRAGAATSPGRLLDGCFNPRPEARPQDAVTSAELIFGSFFLFECLHLLTGRVPAPLV